MPAPMLLITTESFDTEPVVAAPPPTVQLKATGFLLLNISNKICPSLLFLHFTISVWEIAAVIGQLPQAMLKVVFWIQLKESVTVTL